MTDWDDAYDNRGYIENAEGYPPKWTIQAKGFRATAHTAGRAELDVSYGKEEREVLDIFHPKSSSRGLLVFVHGGYWRAFDKSYWSHLASGPLEHGWSVCIPSYTLAPDVRISRITRQIAQAIRFSADRIDGPIRLGGHSAGGHLVTRMVCKDTLLPIACQGRIEHVVSISGVHDLRPLLKIKLNETLQLDAAEAASESPALLKPTGKFSLTCWVGEKERPEFLRQNDLLFDNWSDAGVLTKRVRDPHKHHFNVIEELALLHSPLTHELSGAAK